MTEAFHNETRFALEGRDRAQRLAQIYKANRPGEHRHSCSALLFCVLLSGLGVDGPELVGPFSEDLRAEETFRGVPGLGTYRELPLAQAFRILGTFGYKARHDFGERPMRGLDQAVATVRQLEELGACEEWESADAREAFIQAMCGNEVTLPIPGLYRLRVMPLLRQRASGPGEVEVKSLKLAMAMAQAGSGIGNLAPMIFGWEVTEATIGAACRRAKLPQPNRDRMTAVDYIIAATNPELDLRVRAAPFSKELTTVKA